MDFISTIEMWTYPTLAFLLLIISAVMFRINGSLYFTLGFGLNFLDSVIWRIVPLLSKILTIETSTIYRIFGHVSVLLYLASVILILAGIIVIEKTRPNSANRF